MRILVATDGSPHAIRAVNFAARLVREVREAEVILVNVGQLPILALSTSVAAGYVVDLAPLAEALEQAGQRVLDEAMKVFAGNDVRVTRVPQRRSLVGGHQGCQRLEGRPDRGRSPGSRPDRRGVPRQRERAGSPRRALPGPGRPVSQQEMTPCAR